MSLLEMGLVGSILIVAILLIRGLAGHRLPKRGFLLLWEIAALRLLLPVMMPAPFRFRKRPETVSVIPTAPRPAVPDLPPPVLQPTVPQQAPPVAQPVPQAAPSFSDWLPALVTIWAVVGAALAVWFVWNYLRNRVCFAQSLPDESALVQAWKVSHPLRRSWQVRVSDRIASPLTYGVLHPVILLPKCMDRTDPAALDGILTHEWTHVQRFDAVAKILFAAALCLHWWNPLVWAMYHFANQDMELACDETVVKRLGRDKRSGYAMTLIDMAQRQTESPALYANLTQKMMQERIVAIMKNKKTSYLAIGAATVLVLVALIVFALGEQKPCTVLNQKDRVLQVQVQLDDAEDQTWSMEPEALQGILTQAEREEKAVVEEEDDHWKLHTAVLYAVEDPENNQPEQNMELRIYREETASETRIIGFVQDGETCYRLLDPQAVNRQIRSLCSLDTHSTNNVFRAIEDSLTWKNDVVSFTIPDWVEQPEKLNIHISGRLETADGFGMSQHFLEGEVWQAGKRYTMPYDPGYTEWEMSLFALADDEEDESEDSYEINLLQFVKEQQNTPDAQAQKLYSSLVYENDSVRFTIPADWDMSQQELHVYAQLKGENGTPYSKIWLPELLTSDQPEYLEWFSRRSRIREKQAWEPGKTYTIPYDPAYTEWSLWLGDYASRDLLAEIQQHQQAGLPDGGTRLSDEELDAIEQIFNQADANGLLQSSFTDPRKIDLAQVFYSGAGYTNPVSEKERALYAQATRWDDSLQLIKVTAKQVDDFLQSWLGLKQKDLHTRLEDNTGWVYLKDYQAYYYLCGDTRYLPIEVVDGTEQDGLLTVQYRVAGTETAELHQMTLVRRPGKHYWIQSNQGVAVAANVTLQSVLENTLRKLHEDKNWDELVLQYTEDLEGGAYSFQLREKQTGRLVGTYAITGDGREIYTYNAAHDQWGRMSDGAVVSLTSTCYPWGQTISESDWVWVGKLMDSWYQRAEEMKKILQGDAMLGELKIDRWSDYASTASYAYTPVEIDGKRCYEIDPERYRSKDELYRVLDELATPQGQKELGVDRALLDELYLEKDGQLYYVEPDAAQERHLTDMLDRPQWSGYQMHSVLERTPTKLVLRLKGGYSQQLHTKVAEPMDWQVTFVEENGLWKLDSSQVLGCQSACGPHQKTSNRKPM